MKILFHTLISFILVCCLAGCSSKRVDLSRHALPDEKNASIIIIKNISYDAHGLPLFRPILSKRPDKAGEQFTLVHLVDGRPVKSFDIFIVDEKLDLERPRNVLYTWAGKGFDIGVVLGDATIRGASGGGKYAWVVFAVGVAMPIVGGVTGFVIGTWAIVPEAKEDIKKLLTPTEVLINFAEYEYDKQNRLILMRMFQPNEKPQELVKTEFFYTKDERIPSQTNIMSYPENRTRTIP